MRRVMGIAVFSGMLGVTFLGLLFTPLFYVLVRGFIHGRAQTPAPIPAEPVKISDGAGTIRQWRPELVSGSESSSHA